MKKTNIVYKILILIIMIVLTLFALYLNQLWPFNVVKKQTEDQTTIKINQTDGFKNSSSNQQQSQKSDNKEAKNIKPEVIQQEGQPNQSTISAVINSKNIVNDRVSIRVTISQYLSKGKCNLTLSKGPLEYKETANIIPNPSSSTCAGFDIPVSKLDPGNWKIKININSEDKSSMISDELEIK